ncbi:hypothetical protein [Roseateles sp. LKC17W]|uniref:Anti-sigma factor n=1 Tax=Pelomonas margarita TaxID=3299031 RepID=A0ABW7FHU6_9BURK
MTPTTPDDDDQHWLDLMAGRTAPDADARTRREAAWLRAAVLSYRVTAPPGAPADADARVGRLLTRARDAGVLASAANDAPPRGKAGAWWRPALAACVALCGVVLVFVPARDGTDDGSALRGAPVQRVETVDVVQRRQQLLRALQAAGFDAQPFERLGRLGIDVSLPVPLPARQAEALKRLGLAAPTGPSLQIEFVNTPAPARP